MFGLRPKKLHVIFRQLQTRSFLSSADRSGTWCGCSASGPRCLIMVIYMVVVFWVVISLISWQWSNVPRNHEPWNVQSVPSSHLNTAFNVNYIPLLHFSDAGFEVHQIAYTTSPCTTLLSNDCLDNFTRKRWNSLCPSPINQFLFLLECRTGTNSSSQEDEWIKLYIKVHLFTIKWLLITMKLNNNSEVTEGKLIVNGLMVVQ